MSAPVRILAFAGSARRDSWNKKLVAIAAEGARAAGAEVTVHDFGTDALPLYDGDAESAGGMPDSVKRWKSLVREHHGLLIACPEYNSSITPLLKNAIDWATRPESKDEPPLVAYQNKVAALVAASPGALGGLRGLRHVREILMNINVLVIPQQFALVKAHEAFDAQGKFTDTKADGAVRAIGGKLAEIARRMR
jgi:chromate reductase, NAD(P)H dehydrogenase (quinone)